MQIIYESKINEIALGGLAEINGTDHDFLLNIKDLTLTEEHERIPAASGRIVTKSILEKIAFKKFTMIIVSAEGNKFIKSPNKSILRQLANSWLVSVVNEVTNRFVRPRIVEQSQSYFKNYKSTFLVTYLLVGIRAYNSWVSSTTTLGNWH